VSVAAEQPLVSVRDLVKVYSQGRRRRPVRAVDGVSFDIRPGETFGLVGESGSGKSTVARLVLRLESPTSGSVLFDSRDVHAASPQELRRLRRQMQIVFQDPVASLNRRKTVEEIISAPLVVHGVDSAALRKHRVRDLLELVGLSQSHARRYPSNLSGGQCQRVGIARALALEPQLVVLDEAVSGLDVSIRAQILNLLRELQARLGLTYLFISHDLAIVRYMATQVAVMYLGQIVEAGDRDHLFRNPRHPYTYALLEAIPEPDPIAEGARRRSRPALVIASENGVAGGCPFRPRCPVGRNQEVCAAVDPPLEPVETGHVAACHFPQEAAAYAKAVSVERSP
jgi:oligopeptide/dipeptide ABC transporter ATP-binding protein